MKDPNDIPTLARTQSIGEGFYHSIPKVTLFGSHLKDHEKTNHHGIVKRCCHIRISRLEFISETRDRIPSTIRIAVGLNKIRRSLITAPIDLTSCVEEIVFPNQLTTASTTTNNASTVTNNSNNQSNIVTINSIPPVSLTTNNNNNTTTSNVNNTNTTSEFKLLNNNNNNNNNNNDKLQQLNNINNNNEKMNVVGGIGPTGINMQTLILDSDTKGSSIVNTAPINISPSSMAAVVSNSNATGGSYGAVGVSAQLSNGPSPSGYNQYINPSLSPRAVREVPPPFLVPKKVYCYPVDIRISFHYDHSLKEHDDYLKITLFRNLPSKRQREQFIPFAFTETNLSQILQQGDFIADLDMSTFIQQKSTIMDNLVTPTSINVTICSVPKEIENIGDAQEYQLNDIALSDDENLFFDSDSYDEDEEEVISYDIPIKTLQQQHQHQQKEKQSHINNSNNNSNNNNNINNNNNTLQVPSSSSSSSNVNSNQSNSTTPPITSLSQKLMEQYEESKKKSIEKKSKLQKLSSLIKPTSSSASKHSDSITLADDEDDRDDNSVDSSSSESDHYDIEFNPPQLLVPTTHQSNHNIQQQQQQQASLPTSASKKQPFPPFIQQQRDSPPGSPFGIRTSGSEFVKQSQIDSYIATISNPDSPMNLFLVNSLRKGGKKLEQYLENKSQCALIRSKFNIVPTRSNMDLNSIFKALLTRHQNRSENIRVVIAGSDSYINSVLKSYVTLLSTKPRGWDPFQFYLLPIGKSNEIASTIANQDPNYHALFIQPQSEWKRFLESEAEPDATLKRDLETKILSYIDKSNTRFAHKFPIGEALLTFPSTTSTAIPFLKGIQIPKSDDVDSSEPDLKIDYWVPKKKGEDHLEIKIPFQYVKLTRLSQIITLNSVTSGLSSLSAQASSIAGGGGGGSGGGSGSSSKSTGTSTSTSSNSGSEYNNPPNPSNSFSLYVLYKDKRSKKNPALYLPKFGKQKKSDKVSYKKEDKSSVSLVITKLMCGPMLSSSSSSSSTVNSDNTMFQVNIDGVEIPGVKYLSVSPQWATHVKQFSIQTFVDTTMSEKSNSPISD